MFVAMQHGMRNEQLLMIFASQDEQMVGTWRQNLLLVTQCLSQIYSENIELSPLR
jgi:hypothetical protein